MLSGFLTPISTLQVPDYISDTQLEQYGLEMLEFGGDYWWTGDNRS